MGHASEFFIQTWLHYTDERGLGGGYGAAA
jgi:hypothetical protein